MPLCWTWRLLYTKIGKVYTAPQTYTFSLKSNQVVWITGGCVGEKVQLLELMYRQHLLSHDIVVIVDLKCPALQSQQK